MQFTNPNTISCGTPLQVSARLLVLCCISASTLGSNLANATPGASSQTPQQQPESGDGSNSPLPVSESVTAESVSAADAGKAVAMGNSAATVPPVAPVAVPSATGTRNRESLPLGPMPAGNLLPKSGVNSESQSSAASAFAAFWPLALVVAIILGAAYFVRRLAKGDPGLIAALGAGGKSPSGMLEVLGRYPVSRTSSFILLRLDRRILLLNQSFGKAGTGFSTLAEVTDAEEVASILIKINQGESKSMHSYLDVAMKQMEKEPPAVGSAAEEPVDTVDVSFTAIGGLRRPSGFTGGVS